MDYGDGILGISKFRVDTKPGGDIETLPPGFLVRMDLGGQNLPFHVVARIKIALYIHFELGGGIETRIWPLGSVG